MKKSILALFFFLWNLGATPAAVSIPSEAPAPEYLDGILKLFPESKEVDPKLLDFQVDPNVHLFQEAEILVTFLHEGAALRNSFGYFLYEDLNEDGAIAAEEIQKREILFEDIFQSEPDGKIKAGDTVSLGKFPRGTNLGFFLIAHGAVQAQETYYTIDALNPDGRRHLAMLVAPDGENIALGIEDLPWASSDRDFNDILFSFTTEPKSALKEVIEAGNIPCISKLEDVPPTPPSPVAPAPEATVEEGPSLVVAAPAVPMLEGGGSRCSLSAAGGKFSGADQWLWLAACLAPILKGFRYLISAARRLP